MYNPLARWVPVVHRWRFWYSTVAYLHCVTHQLTPSNGRPIDANLGPLLVVRLCVLMRSLLRARLDLSNRREMFPSSLSFSLSTKFRASLSFSVASAPSVFPSHVSFALLFASELRWHGICVNKRNWCFGSPRAGRCRTLWAPISWISVYGYVLYPWSLWAITWKVPDRVCTSVGDENGRQAPQGRHGDRRGSATAHGSKRHATGETWGQNGESPRTTPAGYCRHHRHYYHRGVSLSKALGQSRQTSNDWADDRRRTQARGWPPKRPPASQPPRQAGWTADATTTTERTNSWHWWRRQQRRSSSVLELRLTATELLRKEEKEGRDDDVM